MSGVWLKLERGLRIMANEELDRLIVYYTQQADKARERGDFDAAMVYLDRAAQLLQKVL